MTLSDTLERMQTAAVLVIGRTLGFHRLTKKGLFATDGYGDLNPPSPIDISKIEHANLVSSRLANNNHAPVIDLDFPAHLIPSSTPGHYHLYLEKEMSWTQYESLLGALYAAGVIEERFFNMCLRFKQSWVRLPYIKKETDD